MPSELVGRDQELGLLVGCLDEATAGRSNLVLCVGEPGIGKTRLADELTRIARARGVVTAWGRASDSAGAPPYWPWREILGALTGVDSRAADPAEQLARWRGDEPSFEERVRRFDAVSQFFTTLARSRPVLLVLDDLHAADEPSQLLARHLARTAPESGLLVVINCRESAGVLGTLAREPNATQLQLAGLDRTAVGRQVAAIVGRDLAETDLSAVFDATTGNPFFVAEIARQLDSDGSYLPSSWWITRAIRLSYVEANLGVTILTQP